MTIYEVLKTDHRKVQSLLEQLVSLSEDSDTQRNALIEQIRDELIPHSRAEEAVFYNSIRALDTSAGLVLHGYQEHLEAEAMLRALQVAGKADMGWKATAKKLQEALAHHIAEEEDEIFAAARQLFSEEEAEAMGDTFESMKPKIKNENIFETSRDMIVNMLPPRISDALRISRPL